MLLMLVILGFIFVDILVAVFDPKNVMNLIIAWLVIDRLIGSLTSFRLERGHIIPISGEKGFMEVCEDSLEGNKGNPNHIMIGWV